MRNISVKLPDNLYLMLEEEARRLNTTKSAVVRRALNLYFSNARKNKPFVTKRIIIR